MSMHEVTPGQVVDHDPNTGVYRIDDGGGVVNTVRARDISWVNPNALAPAANSADVPKQDVYADVEANRRVYELASNSPMGFAVGHLVAYKAGVEVNGATA